MTRVEGAHLPQDATDAAYMAHVNKLEELITKKFPADRIVLSGKALEACLTICRTFCTE